MHPGLRVSPQRKARWKGSTSADVTHRWRMLATLFVACLGISALVFLFTDSSVTALGGAARHGGSQLRRLKGRSFASKPIRKQLRDVQIFGSDSEAEPLFPLDTENSGDTTVEDWSVGGSKAHPVEKSQEEADKAILSQVPADFDWQSYLSYHPEVLDSGVVTEAQAKEHYAVHGRQQRLLYKRLRVIMRYTACTGLINQLYSHIAALSLGAVLGAEVVLPPAAKRDSFAHHFSMFKEQNEVVWSAAPLESLLDVNHIISFWGERGMRIHKAQALEPFPDLTEPDSAFVAHLHPGVDERCSAKISGVYLQHLEMDELVERARRAVIGRAEELLQLEPDTTIDAMVLDLPCTFFMLRSESNLRLAGEVARSLRWSPTVQQLADRVIQGIRAGGTGQFNSVHLRIEKDARDWSLIMGGEAVVWANYVDAMNQAGFSAGQGLYIASGLLTYGANDEMDHLVATLKQSGLCKTAHYKELYLPQAEIEALNSEQKALLDFLVLAQGHSFVGFGSSTFSYYLREFRSLMGKPPALSVLVDASVIGTDWLFQAAGKVV